MRLWRLVIIMMAGLMPTLCSAVELSPRSVLFLDQSGPGLTRCAAVTSALRSNLNRSSAAPISVYVHNTLAPRNGNVVRGAGDLRRCI
jgi:hypothetical protein